eukprot:scpid64543/ scgid32830/ 
MALGAKALAQHDDILTYDGMLATKMVDSSDIHLQFYRGKGLEMMARYGLLANQYRCQECDGQCMLVASTDTQDIVKWQCRSHRDHTASVRLGSIFEKSQYSLQSLFKIIYHWAYKEPQNTVCNVLPLDDSISKGAVIGWYSFFRDICGKWLHDHPMQLGGLDHTGEPIVVEIGQWTYRCLETDQCQWEEDHYVFGAVERQSKRCLLQAVPDCTEMTLVDLVSQWLLPGTYIFSSDHSAYDNLSSLNGGAYKHDVLHACEGFVKRRRVSIHTQNVKNMWSRAKFMLSMQVWTQDTAFAPYLDEFMWRERFAQEDRKGVRVAFVNLVNAIRTYYPLPETPQAA